MARESCPPCARGPWRGAEGGQEAAGVGSGPAPIKHLLLGSKKEENPRSTRNMGNGNFKEGLKKMTDFSLKGKRKMKKILTSFLGD